MNFFIGYLAYLNAELYINTLIIIIRKNFTYYMLFTKACDVVIVIIQFKTSKRGRIIVDRSEK